MKRMAMSNNIQLISRRLKWIMLVCMIILLNPVHVQAASVKQKAFNAYKVMLENPKNSFGRFEEWWSDDDTPRFVNLKTEFAIGYVDKNKTPELFVRCKAYESGDGYMYLLYTYINGRVKLIDGNYYGNSSNLWSEQQIAGYYKKTGVYVWKGLEDVGKTKMIVRLKSGRKKDLAFGGRKTCLIGKKKVSKRAYKKYVKKVSKKRKLSKLKWMKNTVNNRNKAF